MGKWSESHSSLHITFQEMLPIVIAFEIWGAALANKCLILHSDNMAVVHILNTHTSKDANIMVLVRRFVLCCINILTKAVHIQGKLNTLPDLLSRFQEEEFHRLAPDMDLLQTPIPLYLKEELHL